MHCSACACSLGVVRLLECEHILCRPCWLSSCTCLCANCWSVSTQFELLDSSGDPQHAVDCVECSSRLPIAETGVSMPCPHSVWLCTRELPGNLAGTPLVYPVRSNQAEKRRQSDEQSSPDIQPFRTPALLNGLDTHCDVRPQTRVLWNPYLSIEITGSCSVRIVHCTRNLRVRMNGLLFMLMRGTFCADYQLADPLRSLAVLAQPPSTFKSGPCRLLAEAEQAPELLFTESFQFFTHPSLNPVLRAESARGMLMGVEPAVSGTVLRDLMVGQGVLQCARCRRAWHITDKFDPLVQMFIDTCGTPGLVGGHLHAVIERAASMVDDVLPQPGNERCSRLRLEDMWTDVSESHRLMRRWRQLPLAGEAALDAFPVLIFVIGCIGFLTDSETNEQWPLARPSELQQLLIELRVLSRWQCIPHATLVCYRHLSTGQYLLARNHCALPFFVR